MAAPLMETKQVPPIHCFSENGGLSRTTLLAAARTTRPKRFTNASPNVSRSHTPTYTIHTDTCRGKSHSTGSRMGGAAGMEAVAEEEGEAQAQAISKEDGAVAVVALQVVVFTTLIRTERNLSDSWITPVI